MNQPFNYRGTWWLPENPEEEVYGELKFIPGDTLGLNLQGVLNKPSNWNGIVPPDYLEAAIIHGVKLSGKEFTLYQCRQKGHSFHGSGLHTTRFNVQFAFDGAHFRDKEIRFKEVSVRYSNIEAWANKRVLFQEYTENDRNKFTLRYEEPTPVTASVNDLEIRIAYYGPNTSGREINEEIVSYETRVEISSLEEEKTIEEFITVIRCLQDFLGLAMGSPTYPIRITGISDAYRIESENGGSFCIPIEIYYLVPWWPAELKTYYPPQMLFTLPIIEEAFEIYINNWMRNYEALKPVITLYFSVIYNPQSYSELRFLSLTQAIETYHRRVFGGKYQTDEEYLEGLYIRFVDVIPAELDPGFKTSLIEGKLRFANEFSLRRRLRELLRRVKGELDFDFVQSGRLREDLISKIVDTRNYLTHYSAELEDRAEQRGEGLFILSTQLQVLLETILLKEIGISKERVKEWITKSQRFRILMSRARQK